MLESMVTSPRPSRAEAADVANAILDGTDAVMLSQETAIGAYPVDSVAMMASIAERTEPSLPYKLWNDERVQRDLRDPSYTIAFSACAAARDLHVAALVVPTLSGRSARLISAHRPQVPILALSPGKETVQRCGFMWGVQAASMPRHESFETLIAATARRARRDHRRPRRARRYDAAADPARVAGSAAQIAAAHVAWPRHPRRTR
jgi:pyruvate kinase